MEILILSLLLASAAYYVQALQIRVDIEVPTRLPYGHPWLSLYKIHFLNVELIVTVPDSDEPTEGFPPPTTEPDPDPAIGVPAAVVEGTATITSVTALIYGTAISISHPEIRRMNSYGRIVQSGFAAHRIGNQLYLEGKLDVFWMFVALHNYRSLGAIWIIPIVGYGAGTEVDSAVMRYERINVPVPTVPDMNFRGSGTGVFMLDTVPIKVHPPGPFPLGVFSYL